MTATTYQVLDGLGVLKTFQAENVGGSGELSSKVTVRELPALPAGSNSIGILGANSGVDIGDVTINNASGASAVNIQDGGNSITVDGTVGVSGSVPVTFDSTISSANSSTTPLGSSAVFTGTSVDVSNFSEIRVAVFADQASAANGLSIQQSTDGTNWDFSDVYTVAASTGITVSSPVYAQYCRVVYTNGASAQATFRLQTVLHKIRTKPSSIRPSDAMSLQNDYEGIISVPTMYNGTTMDLQRGDTTNGLDVDVTRVSGTVAVTQSGTWNITNLSSITSGIAPGVASTSLGKAEDAAHSSGDVGVMTFHVRRDTPTTSGSAAGDYVTINQDANGLAWTCGQIAHDSAVIGAPFRTGGRAITADVTAVQTGDQVDYVATILGKQIVKLDAIPNNTWVYAAAAGGLVNTTGVTVKSAGAAGVRNYVKSIQVINSHATISTEIVVRDGASGTVLHRGWAQAAGGGYAATFDPPLRGSAATLLEIAEVTTTASTGVLVSMQGFIGAE